MAKGQCEGVGPVGRIRFFRQVEQDLYHPLDLRLPGVAPAGDGLFDFVGAVLHDRDARFG